ncbi:WG repeat-containing protein [Flavobacterium sp. ZT3R18]|uniref:WG repeat-containing protein n=1 Tax=Flavobacterium sp. ZT3R18 TaxID=2594429 RepID=UPI00117A785E|nr:WG repeat-containing protein [Flavobacterium sp. ZT3R18]TRX38013.1 WG repeat-containing protein [Flavobacterium sp. ZT3R18]
MKTILTLLLVFISMLTFGQKKVSKDCLIAYIDTTSGKELTGYKSLNGEIIIKAKYLNGSDTLCGMAIVLNSEFGFVGINRNDSIILKPYTYDNGPDYLEEGLFRFVENGKIGFANLEGQKIIRAKYDFVTPFSDGISEYSIGGEEIYENGKSKKQIIQESGYEGLVDKHWTWSGDVRESGYLNKYGQQFEKVTELKNNKREAWTKDKKHFLLNQKGQIIKTYNK